MLIVPGAVMLADVTYVDQKVVPLMKTLSVGSFNAADLADGLAIVMVAAGGVILFIATLGICGACKKARSCLCVVSTLTIIGNLCDNKVFFPMKMRPDFIEQYMFYKIWNKYHMIQLIN